MHEIVKKSLSKNLHNLKFYELHNLKLDLCVQLCNIYVYQHNCVSPVIWQLLNQTVNFLEGAKIKS